ncbi:hypothetical protein JCM19231_226 [Vibrio ishigakensis]|uniref:Lipoprotein n=1 Tax=Vibrio ishigakensis TaxID=1481914 RepID=A0A0B8NTX2_9VIBR|nr:hypothetical protein [Vibrio ishigakensis]GAM54234.1 hypothetical protein JCM19231_226 [Vibrio ishigakensis]
MKLKAAAGALVCASLLIGCASSEVVQWQKESSAMVENTNINLESRMWLNKMPMIGEEASIPLHGSIILSADQDIPADLGVVSIWLRHNDESVEISEDNFEVEAVNENQWKISFKQTEHFEEEVDSVDIAILMENEQKKVWLAEQGVKVDLVF